MYSASVSDHEAGIPLTRSFDRMSLPLPPPPASLHQMKRRKQGQKQQGQTFPSSRRFWADFTLGFADGLTVPFALTAGLSSLGRTDTVLFAGLAEISAGCISMGIGGYLQARQAATTAGHAAATAAATTGTHGADDDDDDDNDDDDNLVNGDIHRQGSGRCNTFVDDEEAALSSLSASSSSSSSSSLSSSSSDAEKHRSPTANHHRRTKTSAAIASLPSRRHSAAADRYLATLDLPADLHRLVAAHIASCAPVRHALAEALDGPLSAAPASAAVSCNAADAKKLTDSCYNYYATDQDDDNVTNDDDDNDSDNVWPVAAGLTVAMGYLVGGALPLWPYFFVTHVGDGLRWSFAVCVVALFAFGFIRDFVESSSNDSTNRNSSCCSHRSVARQRYILPCGKRSLRLWLPWRRIFKSACEGLQMVVLGGIAASAAVLCVRMFEGASAEAAAAQ